MKSSLAAVLLILQGVANLFTSAVFLAIPNIALSFVEEMPSFVLSFFSLFFGAFVVVGILQIVAGTGVLTGAQWSWGFGIGVSVLGLFNVPIGTVLAIICLIVLLSSREEFDVEKGGNEEWPLILGTMLVVAGALWVLAAYVKTPYAWAMAFGIIGIALMILDRALKTETRGLEILGEISLGVGVFLALFVSNIRIEYLAVPIIVSGLLIILAYYISRKSRVTGRIIAVLCIAAVLGSVCSPLYQTNVSIEWDGDWIGKERVVSEISETKYFEPKERVSINNIKGDIIIKGWDENRIKLDYTKRASGGYLPDDMTLDDITIGIRESDDELVVVTKMPEGHSPGWVAVDYRLMLPRDISADLTLNSVSGDISISNTPLSSEVILKTVSGEIEITGVDAESLRAHIISGDIKIRRSSFQELDIDTVSGDAEIDLAHAGDARIKTTSGDVNLRVLKYDGVMIDARTVGGDIDFKPRAMIIERKSEKEITARIDPVRYHIDLETVSGDIEIM